MRKKFGIILFLIILVADLIAVFLNNESWRYFTKPLVVISLIVYFILQTSSVQSDLKKWILLALVFSLGGDIFLLFESKDPVFFLLGLSSFLIAHIFYIVFFHFVRIRENIAGNILLLLVVVVYYTALMTILSPYLESLKLPVRIYGVVISFMLLLALHTGFITNKNASLMMIIGAVLFIISDSLLALNKFYASFDYAGIAVMLTYGLAQLFIAEGAIKYIRGSEKSIKTNL
jgi:uncharacterized membrane protein YhhN